MDKTLVVKYWESERCAEVTLRGTVRGYRVGYLGGAELPWVVITKSRMNTVLGAFGTQDDMEILMNASLEDIK